MLYPGLLDGGLSRERVGEALATHGQRLCDGVVARLHASAVHVHDRLGLWPGHAPAPGLAELLANPDRMRDQSGPQGCDVERAVDRAGAFVVDRTVWRWPFDDNVDYLVEAIVAARDESFSTVDRVVRGPQMRTRGYGDRVVARRSPVFNALSRGGPLLRAAIFLLLGTQALHHLRYLIAPDHDAGVTLAGHGHGEFHLAASGPAITVVLALLLAWLVVRAAGAPSGVPAKTVKLRRVWPLAVIALLASYGSQELLEGALGHGHEGGFGALLDNDGWVVLPLAVALGGLIALAVRVARAAEALVVAPLVRFTLTLTAPGATFVSVSDRPLIRPAFSLDGAGRGPPVAV